MPNLKEIRQINLSKIVQKKEETGLRFFRECIYKTNQFSAQFVLNKLLNSHKNHVNDLKKEALKLVNHDVDQRLVSQLEEKYSPKELCTEFDLSTLTYLEATKIVIRMAELDIDFYSKFIEKNLNRPTREVLNKIIARKTAYVSRLRNEYSRLDYSR